MNKLLYIYVSLFPVSYISIYIDYSLTVIPNVLIIFLSYYFIIFKAKVEPILFLMIFSKPLVGFIAPGNVSIFILMNIIVNYLPITIAFIIYTYKDKNINLITHYIFTILYLIIYLLYSIPAPEHALYLVTKEFLPLLLFVATVGIFYKNINYEIVILFFRFTMPITIFILFFTDYYQINMELLSITSVNRIPIDNPFEVFSSFFLKNGGFFWDTRIMGIFSYIYIYITLMHKSEKQGFDLLLAAFVLLSTLSRGSILVGFILFVIFFIKKINSKERIKFIGYFVSLFVVLTSIGLFIISKYDIDQNFLDYFSLFSDNNAIDQRGGFRTYSLNVFYNNVFGEGIGYLKSTDIIRTIPVGNATYTVVTDAYIFSKLGEMGLVGFIIFVFSTLEIMFRKCHYTIGLLFGYFIQLIGTDIPDMGFFYFVFLILLSHKKVYYSVSK